MGNAYPPELRKRVVETYLSTSMTMQQVADRFLVSLSSVES